MTGLLVIGAHPDDAEHLAGATARAEIERGRSVTFLVLTAGERWVVDSNVTDAAQIAAARREEAEKAASELGVTVRFADLQDGTLDQLGQELTLLLVGAIRSLRPEVIITHSAREGHPDHRAASAAVLRVCNVLAEPAPVGNPRWFPDSGEPHSVRSLYFTAHQHDLYDDAAIFIGVTTSQADAKVQALLCHRTQYTDATAFEERIRLTMAATGQIAGADRAEAFIPAPGYRRRARYTHLP